MRKIIGRRKRDRPFFALSTERENGRGTSWKLNSNRNLKPHSTDPSLLLTPPSRQPSLTEWDLVSNKQTVVLRRQRSENGESGIKRIDRVQITTRLALRQIEWRRANASSNSFIFLRWWFHPYQLVCLILRFTTKVTLIGTLQLDLTALIKPATNARSCKLPDATNPAPTLDVFKQKRCYGWWSTSSLQTGTLRDTVGTLQNTMGVAASSLDVPKKKGAEEDSTGAIVRASITIYVSRFDTRSMPWYISLLPKSNTC